MAKMNNIEGYKVNGLFGEAERLIHLYHAIEEIAEKTNVTVGQICKFVKQEEFKIKTYSREKMSFGNRGCEVYTTDEEVRKLFKFVMEHLEAIEATETKKEKKTVKVLVHDSVEDKDLMFASQTEAVKFMGFPDPRAVTLRVGHTYKNKRFSIISKGTDLAEATAETEDKPAEWVTEADGTQKLMKNGMALVTIDGN